MNTTRQVDYNRWMGAQLPGSQPFVADHIQLNRLYKPSKEFLWVVKAEHSAYTSSGQVTGSRTITLYLDAQPAAGRHYVNAYLKNPAAQEFSGVYCVVSGDNSNSGLTTTVYYPGIEGWIELENFNQTTWDLAGSFYLNLQRGNEPSQKLVGNFRVLGASADEYL